MIKFLKELIFPHLCYGCSAPGQLLCSQCLRRVQRIKALNRCEYCFSPLQITERIRCSQCSPSLCRTRSLFVCSSVVQSIYRHACCEKTVALQFFLKEIHKVLVLEQQHAEQMIYDVKLRKLACMITKHLDLPYAPQPLTTLFKRKHALQLLHPTCILSVYPLDSKQRLHIEASATTNVICMSLFDQGV